MPTQAGIRSIEQPQLFAGATKENNETNAGVAMTPLVVVQEETSILGLPAFDDDRLRIWNQCDARRNMYAAMSLPK
jgi:hypothetical protein